MVVPLPVDANVALLLPAPAWSVSAPFPVTFPVTLPVTSPVTLPVRFPVTPPLAVIGRLAMSAPVLSKYACRVGVAVESNTSRTFAAVPVVPFTVRPTTLLAVGAIVFTLVALGFVTRHVLHAPDTVHVRFPLPSLVSAPAAFAGIVLPFSLTTLVAPCVPVTSPASEPVKLAALPLTFPVTLPVSGPEKPPAVTVPLAPMVVTPESAPLLMTRPLMVLAVVGALMAPLVVRPLSVPTLVSEDPVTLLASVEPVSVPAAAGTVIFAVPSKLTPLMVRAVARAVAVAALPAMFPLTLDPAIDVIHDGSAYDPLVYTPFVTVPAFPLMSPTIVELNVFVPPIVCAPVRNTTVPLSTLSSVLPPASVATSPLPLGRLIVLRAVTAVPLFSTEV